MRNAYLVLIAVVSCSTLLVRSSSAEDTADRLASWREGMSVRPVSAEPSRHTIHSYFNTSPESPDGRWVLYFTSTTPEAHRGEVRIVERSTGQEKVLARNVTVEDAHRVACQQWASGGKRVVFHDLRGDQWIIAAVDVDTLQEKVLATGRQLAFGQPNGDLVPLYGPHWNPGSHRDLELLNVETGETRTAVTADAVKRTFPDSIAGEFGEDPVSIFFPIISPDSQRAFFKLATPAGGDFRSPQASHRQGLVVCDLQTGRLFCLREKWGHPAWHPDSRTILETGGLLIDSGSGLVQKIPDLPKFPGTHPSVSPDGRLFVTDTTLEPFGGTKSEWGIVVGDLRGRDFTIIHRFDNSHGATSWRPSHPHPVFSPDGKRIYFNVGKTQWTQLYVAEAPAN
jgi:hypothetical protein